MDADEQSSKSRTKKRPLFGSMQVISDTGRCASVELWRQNPDKSGPKGKCEVTQRRQRAKATLQKVFTERGQRTHMVEGCRITCEFVLLILR